MRFDGCCTKSWAYNPEHTLGISGGQESFWSFEKVLGFFSLSLSLLFSLFRWDEEIGGTRWKGELISKCRWSDWFNGCLKSLCYVRNWVSGFDSFGACQARKLTLAMSWMCRHHLSIVSNCFSMSSPDLHCGWQTRGVCVWLYCPLFLLSVCGVWTEIWSMYVI